MEANLLGDHLTSVLLNSESYFYFKLFDFFVIY